MHLVSYGPKIVYGQLYQKRSTLTRVDSLPHFFRKMRVHRNLTKGTLAAKFGFSKDYVSAVEGGSKFPSLKFCLLCGQEFGANPNWIKNKWARWATKRFTKRIRERLKLDD